jgi:hypothetical protein
MSGGNRTSFLEHERLISGCGILSNVSRYIEVAKVQAFTDSKPEVKVEPSSSTGAGAGPVTPISSEEPDRKQLSSPEKVKVEAGVRKEEAGEVKEEGELKLALEPEPLPPPGKLGVKAGLDKTPGSRAEAVRQIYRRACVIHCPKWPKASPHYRVQTSECGYEHGSSLFCPPLRPFFKDSESNVYLQLCREHLGVIESMQIALL